MLKLKVKSIHNNDFTVEIGSDLTFFDSFTILQLKEKLKATNGWTDSFDDVSLYYGSKSLNNDQKTFSSYGIKVNSELTSGKYYNPFKHFEIKFTDAPDAITGDNSGPLRAILSCGHAADPNSLTGFCRSLIDDGLFEFRCPALIESDSGKCNKPWPYEEIRKLALFNEAETELFERKLSENAAAQFLDIKECPNCNSFVERTDLENLRVVCLICKKLKGKTYEFCWQCEQEWTVPISKASDTCGRVNCVNKNIEALAKCTFIKLNSCPNLPNIPNFRACVTCGQVVEHDGTGCKNVVCPRCKVEFCFVCLETTAECKRLKPSSYFTTCSKSLQPIQTKIPVWKKK